MVANIVSDFYNSCITSRNKITCQKDQREKLRKCHTWMSHRIDISQFKNYSSTKSSLLQQVGFASMCCGGGKKVCKKPNYCTNQGFGFFLTAPNYSFTSVINLFWWH